VPTTHRTKILCDGGAFARYKAAMSFADFPEQAQAVALLQRSLQRGRLAHAYLFAGSDLAELEGMARTLAKTLNCAEGRTPDSAARASRDSCDRCASCRRIDASEHPDVLWLRPVSKLRAITIEQVRDAMRSVNLKPLAARFKVTVLVAADRLTVQAANAFLKTLEEPPAHSVFVLLSTEPQRLLETIRSRCLRLNFAGGNSARRLTPEQTTWLTRFGETAAAAEGGLLARYRLLDQLLAHLGQVRENLERALEAESPLEKCDDIEPAQREQWEDELKAAIEAEYRRQRADLLAGLLGWLRDVWLKTLRAPDALMALPELGASADAVARKVSPRDAQRNTEILEELQRLLNTNVQEALALEVGLLRLKL
jgi:DNA polymerase-3 subunit delta'